MAHSVSNNTSFRKCIVFIDELLDDGGTKLNTQLA